MEKNKKIKKRFKAKKILAQTIIKIKTSITAEAFSKNMKVFFGSLCIKITERALTQLPHFSNKTDSVSNTSVIVTGAGNLKKGVVTKKIEPYTLSRQENLTPYLYS